MCIFYFKQKSKTGNNVSNLETLSFKLFRSVALATYIQISDILCYHRHAPCMTFRGHLGKKLVPLFTVYFHSHTFKITIAISSTFSRSKELQQQLKCPP